jgi:RNA polymerase sigma factor (sigma-70 family)
MEPAERTSSGPGDAGHNIGDGGAAFHALVQPHVRRLLAYLDRHIPPRLRPVIDPQDVAQDALFEAARSLDRVSLAGGPEGVWRWVVTIARHRLINVIQAHDAAKRGGGLLARLHEDEAPHGSVIVMLQDLAAAVRTPSQSAARRELLVLLDRSIEQLQPAYRDAVRARYVQALSLKEAAERIGRTEDATQKLCVRGLQALRQELRSFSNYA